MASWVKGQKYLLCTGSERWGWTVRPRGKQKKELCGYAYSPSWSLEHQRVFPLSPELRRALVLQEYVVKAVLASPALWLPSCMHKSPKSREGRLSSPFLQLAQLREHGAGAGWGQGTAGMCWIRQDKSLIGWSWPHEHREVQACPLRCTFLYSSSHPCIHHPGTGARKATS